MLTLRLKRKPSQVDYTEGAIYLPGAVHPFCYTLEDEMHAVKVKGETRIPAGKYRIKLRTEGGMHPKYKARFHFHKGMLWLQDVPGFEFVYIHIGNTDDDTEGCILVGMSVANGYLSASALAYEKLYPIIASAVETEGAEIIVEDS